jgi:ferredoxin-nitrite reductase
MQDFGFTAEQKQYLEGFIAALIKKRGAELPTSAALVEADAHVGSSRTGEELKDPAYIHLEAQDRWLKAGGKLAPEELAKQAKHPFDMWDEMLANAAAGRFPKGTDIFLHKFHGLFYVAPNQDAFMLRLRLPGGIVSSHQANGLCSLAERFGGGYLHVTTRANLQIREIGAAHSIAVLTAVDELGLTSRGAGPTTFAT